MPIEISMYQRRSYICMTAGFGGGGGGGWGGRRGSFWPQAHSLLLIILMFSPGVMASCKHTKSAPYHPCLTFHSVAETEPQFKASLHDGRSLIQRVSSYLLSYRTTSNATTGVPPCQLLMQCDLRIRFSLLQPDREKTVQDRQALQKSGHDRCARARSWAIGERVMA